MKCWNAGLWQRHDRDWSVSAMLYQHILWGKGDSHSLFFFYHHLELNNQSIKPTVKQLFYVFHDSSISRDFHLIIWNIFFGKNNVQKMNPLLPNGGPPLPPRSFSSWVPPSLSRNHLFGSMQALEFRQKRCTRNEPAAVKRRVSSIVKELLIVSLIPSLSRNHLSESTLAENRTSFQFQWLTRIWKTASSELRRFWPLLNWCFGT